MIDRGYARGCHLATQNSQTQKNNGPNALTLHRSDKKTYENLHVLVQIIIHNQIVGHANAMWLHWVPRSIVMKTNIFLVKVAHSFLRSVLLIDN